MDYSDVTGKKNTYARPLAEIQKYGYIEGSKPKVFVEDLGKKLNV